MHSEKNNGNEDNIIFSIKKWVFSNSCLFLFIFHTSAIYAGVSWQGHV